MADQALAAAETVFEVQQLRSGCWDRISTHGSREDATTAADAFAWRNRQAEVRVLHSRYDENSGRYVERIVFRHNPSDPSDVKVKEQESAYSRVAGQTQKQREAAQSARRVKKSRQQEKWRDFAYYMRLLILFVLICAGGAAALNLL